MSAQLAGPQAADAYAEQYGEDPGTAYGLPLAIALEVAADLLRSATAAHDLVIEPTPSTAVQADRETAAQTAKALCSYVSAVVTAGNQAQPLPASKRPPLPD